MANTTPVKIMLPNGDIEKIDQLIKNQKFASRADFATKAVFLLLTSMDDSARTMYNRSNEPSTEKTLEKRGREEKN